MDYSLAKKLKEVGFPQFGESFFVISEEMEAKLSSFGKKFGLFTLDERGRKTSGLVHIWDGRERWLFISPLSPS